MTESQTNDLAQECGFTPAQVNQFVDAYCEAWEQSFLADNPYHTVDMSSEYKKHIESGLIAVLRSMKK